eukprot:scaffold151865_cov30-Prasinocladus_malaysianus.AAC.1
MTYFMATAATVRRNRLSYPDINKVTARKIPNQAPTHVSSEQDSIKETRCCFYSAMHAAVGVDSAVAQFVHLRRFSGNKVGSLRELTVVLTHTAFNESEKQVVRID